MPAGAARRLWIVPAVCLIALALPVPVRTQSRDPAAPPPAAAAEAVLVVVNGQPIRRGDLEFLLLARRVAAEERAAVEPNLLEELIDRQLIRGFLARRGVVADEPSVDAHVEAVQRVIRRAGDDPRQVLARLGYDDKTLRHEVALPVMWGRYVRSVVTAERLRRYFEEHRAELDGTQLRASQIFLKAEDDGAAAAERLAGLREEILSGRTTFAEAARRHSQAPSAGQGGDVGYFPFRGKMPAAFADAAFRLQDGEISPPFRTRFGVHLVTVTGRKPGELSLEDVRDSVLERLSDELWRQTVASERQQAVIEWK